MGPEPWRGHLWSHPASSTEEAAAFTQSSSASPFPTITAALTPSPGKEASLHCSGGKLRIREMKFCVEPEPGDLIETFRTGYEYWAIYVEGGDVIHVAPPSEKPGAGIFSSISSIFSSISSIFSILSSRAVVKQQPLRDVAGGCRYRVNNYLDHKYRPQPVYKSISAAKEMVGEEKKYSVLSMNCERFATELRYGAASSRQVEHAMCVLIGMLIIFIMLIILVPWLAALLAPSKKSRQNQLQPDEATGCCIRSRCGDQWRGPPTATLSAWHSHLGSM
uniref:LRAT domain-containing protein n=1 Tax=Equus caballus TaxID=9796 RepID=A0A3Q2HWJ4_HORSE